MCRRPSCAFRATVRTRWTHSPSAAFGGPPPRAMSVDNGDVLRVSTASSIVSAKIL